MGKTHKNKLGPPHKTDKQRNSPLKKEEKGGEKVISPQTKLKPEEKGTSDQHGTSGSYLPHALSGGEAAAFLPQQLFLFTSPSGPSPPTTTCCQTPCLHTTRSTPTCTGQIPAPHRQLLVRPAGHRAGCAPLQSLPWTWGREGTPTSEVLAALK